MTRPIAQRFWEKVDIGHPDECWGWLGKSRDGRYGSFAINSMKSVQAHRMAYMISRGPIPDGLLVCHSCDNPPCCNPDHLWVGTMLDNWKDSVQKGRNVVMGQRGENHHRAKLTDGAVVAIRDSNKSGAELARKYNVHHSVIGKIRNRIAWKHLP